jgi:hypothetical protein
MKSEMANYTEVEVAALNAAAERFLKLYPREPNRNMFLMDTSLPAGKYEFYERMDMAMSANYDKAARGMHGRISQKKRAEMNTISNACDAWSKMKRDALEQLGKESPLEEPPTDGPL